jgi:hypothetical protein
MLACRRSITTHSVGEMNRVSQIALLSTFVLFSWLMMQVVHELGHVVAAVYTGGNVQTVVLHPLALSRTDVAPNPSPLVEVWAGPIVGCLIPLMIVSLWTLLKIPRRHLPGFFAGFCLVANGLYLSVGSFDRVGDAGQLMALGMSQWVLFLFGILTIPSGFYALHRASDGFGFGDAKGKVAASDVLLSTGVLLVVVTVELFCA